METWTLEKNTEELRTMDGKLSYNSSYNWSLWNLRTVKAGPDLMVPILYIFQQIYKYRA